MAAVAAFKVVAATAGEGGADPSIAGILKNAAGFPIAAGHLGSMCSIPGIARCMMS